MQRPSPPFRSPFLIELVRYCDGIRIHFNHGPQVGASFIDRIYPRQVFFDKCPRRISARFDPLCEDVDCSFVQFKGWHIRC